MSGSSNPEVIVARAQELVDKNEVEYVNTNGNTHNFQGKGHKANDTTVYIITAEIQLNGEIEWSCSCVYNEYHDDCKHTIACNMLMKTMKLREEHIVLSSDADVVVGKVAYKIESDDD